MGTHRVYVITVDRPEPVILSSKQLENHDFAEQLSPEDRQWICRVIGGLLYASKTRIQVDQSFNGHLLGLIAKVQGELQESMQDDISSNDRAMKLSSSEDKRTTEIPLNTLSKTHARLERQANSFDVSALQAIEVFEIIKAHLVKNQAKSCNSFKNSLVMECNLKYFTNPNQLIAEIKQMLK